MELLTRRTARVALAEVARRVERSPTEASWRNLSLALAPAAAVTVAVAVELGKRVARLSTFPAAGRARPAEGRAGTEMPA